MDLPKEKKVKMSNNPLTLPFDVILDIFSRLPGKSIRRFGCVSRDWYASLSDSSFRSLHGDISRKKPLFINYTNFAPETSYDSDDSFDDGGECCCPMCVSGDEEEDFPQNQEQPPTPTISLKTENKSGTILDEYHLFDLDGGGKVIVIPSGRELICLYRSDHKTLYVSNPTTRELLKLPKPSISLFDCIHYFLLCYIPSLGHFRLLHAYKFDPFVTSFQVLDIKPGEKPTGWRVCCKSFHRGLKLINSVQNVDASAFWYTKPDPNFKFDNVFCYDFEREVCRKINKPHGCSDSFGPLTSLVGLKGCLSLINVIQDGATMTMDIWLLKDFRNSEWQKEYTLDTSSVGINRILPVHFGEREIIFDTYPTTGETRMIFYDMVTKTWCTGGHLTESGETGRFLYFEGLYPLAADDYASP